ncbi:MAG: signal peptidase I [Candidatus Aenigmarchaeota archaeon]|nr:signal peptidase I [Candidatus Aenigmarchaeota archaeon]
MKKIVLAVVLIAVFTLSYISAGPAATAVASSIDNKALEKDSPQDHVSESQIFVDQDKVTIDIKEASWLTFTDTNSMDPVFDAGANAIIIKPKTIEDIKAGDIISYYSDYGLIIHRVIRADFDEQGWYVIAKGDNNPVEDLQKIRFSQIHGVVVAVIY